jgi:hypothetical protein
MKALINLIIDLFAWIYNIIKKIIQALFEKFLSINLFEKGIVIATIIAFIAVVAPMAQYMIFDSSTGINNPDAHYLIGIVLVMLITIYFPGRVTTAARVGLNILYLVDVIYLYATHEISKAPYEITAGYYFNIMAPVIYIVFALGSALSGRES